MVDQLAQVDTDSTEAVAVIQRPTVDQQPGQIVPLNEIGAMSTESSSAVRSAFYIVIGWRMWV